MSKGGSRSGLSPVGRGRNGTKYHLITDATGIAVAATLTGGNRNCSLICWRRLKSFR